MRIVLFLFLIFLSNATFSQENQSTGVYYEMISDRQPAIGSGNL